MTQPISADDTCPICGEQGYYAHSEQRDGAWFDHYHGPCPHEWDVPHDGGGLEEFDGEPAEDSGDDLPYRKCPKCGCEHFLYEVGDIRDCGCTDTEAVYCAECNEYLGMAQCDGCDCDDWRCEWDEQYEEEEEI